MAMLSLLIQTESICCLSVLLLSHCQQNKNKPNLGTRTHVITHAHLSDPKSDGYVELSPSLLDKNKHIGQVTSFNLYMYIHLITIHHLFSSDMHSLKVEYYVGEDFWDGGLKHYLSEPLLPTNLVSRKTCCRETVDNGV